MKRFVGMISVFAVLSIALGAWADDAPAKKAIMVQYGKLATAMKAKNAKAVLAVGTPDMSYIMSNGMKESGKQMAEGLKQFFAMTKSIKRLDFKVHRITVKGSRAVAESSNTFDGSVTGQDGKAHQMKSVTDSTDTWVKTPKGWRCKLVVEKRSKFWMDGKPFDPYAGMSEQQKK